MTTPTPARPAPAGADLPTRIAEVMLRHHIDPNRTDAGRNDFCVCGGWVSGEMSPGWDDHLAEVAVDALAPVLADRDARIAALEQRLEDLAADLAAATHFLVGAYRVGRRHDHWEVWADPSRIGLVAGRDGDPITCLTREEALATARRLTAEEADRA